MSKITDGFKALYGDEAKDRTRAFIVDDEPAIARGAGRVLRSPNTGIATTVDCADPKKAVEELLKEGVRDSVALVVSDFNMPGMTGVELAGRLRDGLGGKKIPFLLMSGGMTSQIKVDIITGAIFAGDVDAFVEKPFEPEDFLAAVEKAIERRIQLFREDNAA